METTINIKKDSNGNITSISIDNIRLSITKRENYWKIYSPQFKTLGFSKESEKDAFEDFETALTIFFKVHINDNTLEKALTEFGWNKPSKNTSNSIHTDIPTQLLKLQSNNFSLSLT